MTATRSPATAPTVGASGRARRRAAPAPAVSLSLVLAAAGAWALLVVWDRSAYARYLHHDGLAQADLAGPLLVAVFVAGWLLMLVAMMLPTVQPLYRAFSSVVQRRADRRRLRALLAIGYLATWTAAGLVAYLADVAVHAAEDRLDWLSDRPWLLASVVLAAAGTYQLTPLKDRCLQQCRSARALVFTRWRGRHPASEALLLGVAHGRFCIACCWALMLVMFAVGAGSLAWMLALAAAMAAEKALPGGARLRVPIGLAALGAAAAVTMTGVA